MISFLFPESVNGLFVTNPINIRYLTGYVSNGAPNEREVYLLMTPTEWYLITYSLYKEETELVAKNNPHITVVFLNREHRLTHAVADMASNHHIKTLGVETNSMLLLEYRALEKALRRVSFVEKQDWIESYRLKKTDEEQELLKQAGRLTDDCFSHIIRYIKEGQSEVDIAWEMESYIRSHGGTLSFPPIVAFNEHSAIPHHLAQTDTDITSPTLILLDFGAAIQGYCADMTRVVFYGPPKEEWKRAYETVLQAQKEALKYLSKGTVSADIQGIPAFAGMTKKMTEMTEEVERDGAKADTLARSIIEHAGYPTYPHGLGHGVGLDIHEGPRLHQSFPTPLQPGMTVTVEPALYLSQQFGIRIEDFVAITEEGITMLSESPKELEEINIKK